MVAAFYPLKITEHLSRQNGRAASGLADGMGSAAAVECGTHIRFEVRLDSEVARVSNLNFRTNGCGFMVAAGDVLADDVRGRRLAELHGLEVPELNAVVADKLGMFPRDREHCLEAVIDALRAAFVDLRRRRIEEFTGEKALVCTCFSVSEETIEDLVLNQRKTSVAAIGEVSNAGTGCGSCQPVIQDMLDALNTRPV